MSEFQQDDAVKKNKKKFYKKWWFWVIVAVVILAIAVPSSGNDDGTQTSQSTDTSSNEQTVDDTQSSTEQTVDLSQVATTYTLADGNYTAGVDIPAGECDVSAVEGTGNLYSSNLYNGGINEMFGIDDGDGYYTEDFSGLELPEGTVLYVSGGLTIQLDYTTVDSDYSGRIYDEDNAIELGSGNYTAGTDFNAGVYKIIAVSGNGNLSSSNIYDGGVNEMFGVNDDYYIDEILNIELPTDTELSVSGGVKIKLIPATIN